MQIVSTRTTARLSPLKNTELKKQLGADMAFLKNKNTAAILKSNPAPAPAFSNFEFQVRTNVQNGFEKYFNGTDINTVLRETEDIVNQQIDSLRKK